MACIRLWILQLRPSGTATTGWVWVTVDKYRSIDNATCWSIFEGWF